MLYPVNDYMLYLIKTETTQRYLREAAMDHLRDQIIPRQPPWLSHQMRKALYHLGHMLVTLGHRLDRIEVRPI